MQQFKLEREQFYSPFRTSYWDIMHGEEYSLLDVHHLSKEEIRLARKAAQVVYDMTAKAIQYLRMATDEELLDDLGVPTETLHILRLKPLSIDSVISRVDLVQVDGTFKAYEINSDTPTFIKECFDMNEHVTRYFQVNNPNNELKEKLGETIRNVIAETAFSLNIHPMQANIVFTSHNEVESNEDYFTVHFLKELANIPHATYCGLSDLQIDESGLYDQNGERIDILYRQTYPIESLIEDKDTDGDLIGVKLLDLVQQRKLAILNPPSAFLMQSKAVQAFIWEAVESDSGLFTEEECSLIKTHFLPTYWTDNPFTKNTSEHYGMYVKKPCFGREGDSISILDAEEGVVHTEKQRNYMNNLAIYQKFIPLPKGKIQTVKGEIDAYLLTGVFVVGGESSAIGIRAASTQITNNLSYYLPVCEKNEKEA